MFEAAFLQPVAEEKTDLYILDLATGALRRLTTDGNDGWIIPEFSWDPAGKRLWWTENRLPPDTRVDFPLDPAGQLQKAARLLESPPTPDVGHATALDVVLPVEQRTRILEFRLPSAKPAAKDTKKK